MLHALLFDYDVIVRKAVRLRLFLTSLFDCHIAVVSVALRYFQLANTSRIFFFKKKTLLEF